MSLWPNLVDLFFPHFCCGCGRYGVLLCKLCVGKIEYYSLPEIDLDTKNLDGISAVGFHTGILKKLVSTLKYQGVQDAGKICGRLIYYSLKITNADVIVPIPLHKYRQIERGFNQVEEIAIGLSQKSQIPVVNLLTRTKNISPQAKITDRGERKKRLKNVFEINQTLLSRVDPFPKIALLIDDVTTTGSTLNECAKIMKNSGVEQVYGIVLAHGR